MRNWILAAGAASLALAAPALAEKGGHGGGQGGGKGQSAQGGHGGGHGGQKAKGGDRGGMMAQAKGSKVERGGAKAQDHARGNGHAMAKVDRSNGGNAIKAAKAERRIDRIDDRNDGRVVGRNFNDGNLAWGKARGFANGCPPGLDMKDNGCLPPGQAKKLIGVPLAASFADNMVPYAYRSWYPDNNQFMYRYGDDYIYRINRSNNLVDGLIPLLIGGGTNGYNNYYMAGDPWPSPYNFYNVPTQYSSYWPDGNDYLYRYGDGAIYQVDPKTAAVRSIVALLAGDLGVGSPLPMGYNTYNVPMAYRDRYYDTANDWYRYNDGYIYRVDPTTRLITAVIDAIT